MPVNVTSDTGVGNCVRLMERGSKLSKKLSAIRPKKYTMHELFRMAPTLDHDPFNVRWEALCDAPEVAWLSNSRN